MPRLASSLTRGGIAMTDGQVFYFAALAALVLGALAEHAILKWRDRRRP